MGKTPKKNVFPLIALILAWFIPGAGHVYIGRMKRGIILFICIAITFWTGIAIGGVMTVDRVNERWWFVADMFTGVHGVVAWYRSDQVHEKLNERLMQDPRWREHREQIQREYSGRGGKSRLFQDYKRFLVDEMAKERVAVVPASTETIARSFAGVAGLLNLMCIFDAVILALMGATGEPTDRIRAQEEQSRKAQQKSDNAREDKE